MKANNKQQMDPVEFTKYLNDQRIEIEKYKWIESEKVGYDLGRSATMEWIHKYAKKYRDEYNANH